MAKKKRKRTVTCGVCQETGHNARTCPERTGPVQESSSSPATPPSQPEVPAPKGTTATAILGEGDSPSTEEWASIATDDTSDAQRNTSVPRRDAPTADLGTAATASPYQCPKCNAVAILVAVKTKDYAESAKQSREVFKSETRCESCLNKPAPSDLILQWGIRPGEQVPVPGQDDA